jgi:hypothetical protein
MRPCSPPAAVSLRPLILSQCLRLIYHTQIIQMLPLIDIMLSYLMMIDFPSDENLEMGIPY